MKKTVMILAMLAATSASALEIILTKQDDGWAVGRGGNYVENLGVNQNSITGSISQSWPFGFNGNCHTNPISDWFKDFHVKGKVSCNGPSFEVTFDQMGKTISPNEVETGSQISIYIDQATSTSPSQSSGNSSVPAKKAMEYPNHYKGRADPSHEH